MILTRMINVTVRRSPTPQTRDNFRSKFVLTGSGTVEANDTPNIMGSTDQPQTDRIRRATP